MATDLLRRGCWVRPEVAEPAREPSTAATVGRFDCRGGMGGTELTVEIVVQPPEITARHNPLCDNRFRQNTWPTFDSPAGAATSSDLNNLKGCIDNIGYAGTCSEHVSAV